MAGNVIDCHCRLDDRVSAEVQKKLGILAVSRQQRFVDRLGAQRRRVRPGRVAALPGFPEYQGRRQEPNKLCRCLNAIRVSWLNPAVNTIESSACNDPDGQEIELLCAN